MSHVKGSSHGANGGLRAPLARFAEEMEKELRRHDADYDQDYPEQQVNYWIGDSPDILFNHARKLITNLSKEFRRKSPRLEVVMDESIDAANMLMMVFDQARRLNGQS